MIIGTIFLILAINLKNVSSRIGSQIIIIRYDNVEEHYKQLHKKFNPLNQESNESAIKFNDSMRLFKAIICHTIIDTLYFRKHNDGYYEIINTRNAWVVKKYSESLFRIELMNTGDKKTFRFFFWKHSVLLDLFPFSNKRMHIGKDILIEDVFPCVIENKRTKYLYHVYLSSTYEGKMFVFKQDSNRKLRVLAVLEEYPSEVIECNSKKTKSPSNGVQKPKKFYDYHGPRQLLYYTKSWICDDLDDYRKLRLCNLAINSYTTTGNKTYIFFPRMDNLRGQCMKKSVSKYSMRKFNGRSEIKVIGCRALNTNSKKNEIVYISTVPYPKRYYQSVYVLTAGKKGKLFFHKHVTDLALVFGLEGRTGVESVIFNAFY